MTDNKTFQCNQCNYISNRKYNLKIHMKKHNETTTQHKFECSICNLTFRDKYNLKVHINSARHIQRVKSNCPDACVKIETKHNEIIIKTKNKIDPSKSHLYLKKVNVTKPKKQTKDKEPKPRAKSINKKMFIDPYDLDNDQIKKLVDLFINYCSKKIDLNDFYDFDFYRRTDPEPEAEYADIIDTINDNDFTLF